MRYDDPTTGKRRAQSFKLKADAARLANKLEAEIADGTYIGPTEVTLSERWEVLGCRRRLVPRDNQGPGCLLLQRLHQACLG